MLKSILLSATICAISLQQTQARAFAPKVNVTRSFQSNGTNPSIVHMDATGYLTVTILKNILTVANTFPQENNKTQPACKLVIDPYEDAIIGRVRTLTFEQSIVVWGIRSVETVDEIKNTRYTMLLVDPRACSYKPLHLPIDEVPLDHPNVPPEVAIAPHPTYGMGFNIFFPTLKGCAPCQYSSRYENVSKLEREVRKPVMGISRALHVQSFGEANNQKNNGYLLAYNYGIGTTRIEYIDRNFTSFARSYLNHSVDVTSIVLSADGRQNIAACYHLENDKITCQRFDSRLYPTASYHVQGDCVAMLFGVSENAFVATAEKSGKVRVWIFNAYGRLVDELEIGTVGNSTERLEVNGFLDYNDKPAKEYCLGVFEFKETNGVEANYTVTCIDVSSYTKMP